MTELTRQEAAAALKISPKSLARLVSDPDCPLQKGRKRGRRMMWPRDEVEAARSWKVARANASKARTKVSASKNTVSKNTVSKNAVSKNATPKSKAKPVAKQAKAERRPLSERSAEFRIPRGEEAPSTRSRSPIAPFAITPPAMHRFAVAGMRMAFDPRFYDPRAFLPFLGPMSPLWWMTPASRPSQGLSQG